MNRCDACGEPAVVRLRYRGRCDRVLYSCGWWGHGPTGSSWIREDLLKLARARSALPPGGAE
jgi:hypothetical protein